MGDSSNASNRISCMGLLVDDKTIRSIIASITDRQSQLMAKIKRMDSERPEAEAEMALNEQALDKWYEALGEIDEKETI